VAAGFGLASILSVIVLGDETGYVVGQVQKVKLAAMEAEWETEPPPGHFTVFGFPNQRLPVISRYSVFRIRKSKRPMLKLKFPGWAVLS
jgi:cytochrome bd-type quinol oxidase subunit 1